jgi:hypothetical protein
MDLTGNSILNGMSDVDVQNLTKRYKSTMAIAERVDAKSITETISNILGVNEQFKKTMDFVSAKLTNSHTSIVHRVAKAINNFIDMAQEDVTETWFGDLSKYEAAYENDTKYAVNDIKQSLEDPVFLLNNIVNSLRLSCNYSQTVDGMFSEEEIANRVFEDNSTLDGPFTVLNLYEGLFNALSADPYRINLTNLSSAVSRLKSSSNIVDVIRDELSSASDLCAIHKEFRDLQKAMTDLIESIDDYGAFLHDLTDWNASLVFQPATADLDSLRIGFKEYYDSSTLTLQKRLQQFARNAITKEDLANSILDMDLPNLSQNITILFNSFKTDVINPLKDEAATYSSNLQQKYTSGLDNLVALEKYFPKVQSITTNAQRAKLWLLPYPVLETRKVRSVRLTEYIYINYIDIQIIMYKYTLKDISRVWPKTTTLENFALFSAPIAIPNTIDSVFATLMAELGDLEINTERRIQALKNEISSLKTFCDYYVEELKIDGDFIE